MPLVLLDLDNTLADRQAAFEHWMATVLPPGDRAFVREYDADGVRPRDEFIAAVRQRLGLEAGVDVLLDEYRRVTLAGLPPLGDDVRTRLVGMRRVGFAIGVVTNGESAAQSATAERIGLLPLVDAIVVSERAGLRKPDPRIFGLAAERCGAALEGAWMIGDGEVDVLGAARAGIRSVWLERGRAWRRDDVRPDVVAGSAAEALDRVAAG